MEEKDKNDSISELWLEIKNFANMLIDFSKTLAKKITLYNNCEFASYI